MFVVFANSMKKGFINLWHSLKCTMTQQRISGLTKEPPVWIGVTVIHKTKMLPKKNNVFKFVRDIKITLGELSTYLLMTTLAKPGFDFFLKMRNGTIQRILRWLRVGAWTPEFELLKTILLSAKTTKHLTKEGCVRQNIWVRPWSEHYGLQTICRVLCKELGYNGKPLVDERPAWCEELNDA